MRSTSAGELTTLAGTTRTVTLRVKVANGSGTMIDYSAWVESVTIDHDVDQPVGGCTISLTRANDPLQSFAPLRTDSTLNVNDVPAYSPALDLNRSVTVEVATNPVGTAPVAGDYKLLFKGTIDVVNFERSPVSIVCRDLGAPLVDRWVEVEATYGSGGGIAIQTVMQSILDDVFGAAVYTLYVPVSPGFNVITYRQQKMSVMDALQDLAQLIGWDIRFKWDDGTSAFRLTLSEPPRTKTTPDYTFAPSTYFDISRLNLDITSIRNAITGSYRNSAAQGNRATVAVSDSTSITKYGRRFFFIQEADVSPIDTSAEMTTMLNAALADMKEPKAEQEVDMPFFWPSEISDLYRYSANAVHYNSNQDIAVVELTHELTRSSHRTRLLVRGTPIGQYATWLGRGTTIGGGTAGNQAFPPAPIIEFLDGETDDTIWNVRFDALYGSGGGGANLGYEVTVKRSFDAVTTLASGTAAALPDDIAIARDPKYDKVVTFTLTDAATGLSAQDGFTMAAQMSALNSTGNLLGASLVALSVTKDKTEARFRCKASHSTSQSVNDAASTALAFDSESYDVGGLHTTGGSNSRITIPAGGDTGTWILTAQVQWDTNTAGDRSISVVKNAAATIAAEQVGAAGVSIQNLIAFDDSPTVGDYYEIFVFQNSGGTRTVASANSCFAALHIW